MNPQTAAALAAALMTSACASSIQSTHHSRDATVGEGVSYYLPKRMIKVTVDRRAANSDKAAFAIAYMKALQAAHDADKLLQLATAAEEESAAALKAALALGDKITAEDLKKLKDADDAAKKTKALAESLLKIRVAELAQKKAALDSAPISSKETPAFFETVAITASPLLPDHSKRFVAQLPHNWFRSDDWNLTVTGAGLLTRADANPSGELDEVVVSLGQFAFAAVNPNGVLGGQSLRSTSGALAGFVNSASGCPPDKEFHFEYEFDPTDSTAYKIIDDGLDGLCALHRIDFKAFDNVAVTDNKPFKKGLAYRRERPFALHVRRFAYNTDQISTNAPPDSFKPHRSAILMIPNGAPIEVLPFGSSYVSAQKLSASFQDGMLTTTDFDKPGEAKTVALIPATVVKGAAELVGEVLTIRTKNLTASASGVEQEVKAVEQAKKLLEAQIAYEKAYSDYLNEKTASADE